MTDRESKRVRDGSEGEEEPSEKRLKLSNNVASFIECDDVAFEDVFEDGGSDHRHGFGCLGYISRLRHKESKEEVLVEQIEGQALINKFKRNRNGYSNRCIGFMEEENRDGEVYGYVFYSDVKESVVEMKSKLSDVIDVNNENWKESFIACGLLGEGSFAEVFKYRHRSSGLIIAIKQANVTTDDENTLGYTEEELLTEEVGAWTAGRTSFDREVRSLQRLDGCDYTVGIIGALKENVWHPCSRKVSILMEYVPMTLRMLINKYVTEQKIDPEAKMPPRLVKRLVHQLLTAVRSFHVKNIMHRDLKPENILYDPIDCTIKVADFGTARTFGKRGLEYTPIVGTVNYNAPEIIFKTAYSEKVDIWACGCIFAELFNLKPLFEDTVCSDVMTRHIIRLLGTPKDDIWSRVRSIMPDKLVEDYVPHHPSKYVPGLCSDGIKLLGEIMVYEPGRSSVEMALKHKYFENLN